MNLLSLSKLNKYFGERALFENVSFSVGEHDKIGLIGANGCGKTTLFKMILDGTAPDGGDIFTAKLTNFGYLEQHIGKNSTRSVYEELLTVFSRLHDLENEITELSGAVDAGLTSGESAAERLHALTEQYQSLGGLTYKNIARASLLGMGFSESDLEKPFSTLSGGEKTRVCLCKILLGDANLLLLDEPTNHLDIQSVEWLENFLSNYPGAFIVISHDRYFLDKVTNKTMEIEHERITCYDGNYSAYLKQKQANETYIARKYENTMREIARIEGIIEQQKRWNREKNIKTAESKQKQVDRLKEDLIVPLSNLENIKPRFEIKVNGGNDVLEVSGVSKSFKDAKLFEDVSFLIRRKEHVFLLGANGCGKTTLFKMIMGQEPVDSGSVSIGANVEIGYFDQLQSSVSHEKTLFDEISDTYPELSNTEIRNALAGFLFQSDDVFKLVGKLSGGERARLMLLKLMLQKANFLLLDEPTNHLDIKSREMLEDALICFPGTIFSISHDRYFINKLANRVLSMEQKGIASYVGDYSYYLEKRAEQAENTAATTAKTVTTGKEDYLRKKQKDAEERKRKNRLLKVEQEIEETEQAVSQLTEELEKPENTTDYVKCAEISKEIEAKNERLFALYEEWETLQA